jgi:hypothetical protein
LKLASSQVVVLAVWTVSSKVAMMAVSLAYGMVVLSGKKMAEVMASKRAEGRVEKRVA